MRRKNAANASNRMTERVWTAGSLRRLHFILVVVPIIKEAAVPSFAHIKASMAPILVSLTYPNSDASDPNIDAFREDNWFAPTFKEPANAGIVRSETRKSANIAFCMTFSSGWDDRHRVAS